MNTCNRASIILSGGLIPELDDDKIKVILAHYAWLDGRLNTELARQRGILRLMFMLSPADRVLVNNWYRYINGGDITAIALPNPPPAPPGFPSPPAYCSRHEGDNLEWDDPRRPPRLNVSRIPYAPTYHWQLPPGQVPLPGIVLLAGNDPVPGPGPLKGVGTSAGDNNTAACGVISSEASSSSGGVTSKI